MSMKSLAAAAVSLAFVATAATAQYNSNSKRDDDPLTITRIGSQPALPGPVDKVIGKFRVDSSFEGTAPARVHGAGVTFEPGARTDWHTHPLGQMLIWTAGTGLVQAWDGKVHCMRPGDMVWTPPGVKHWHGATPTEAATHIAIEEELNGVIVNWLEKVVDAQYHAPKKGCAGRD